MKAELRHQQEQNGDGRTGRQKRWDTHGSGESTDARHESQEPIQAKGQRRPGAGRANGSSRNLACRELFDDGISGARGHTH